MEKIIPFKKDIIFKTNLSEITSISLEHNLSQKDQYLVNGIFTVSGEYKMAEDSVILDSFSYELPFDINIDDRYDTSKIKIDIDDFYYEIVNDNVLSVSIDVLLSNLEEVPVERLEDIPEKQEEEMERLEEKSIEKISLEEMLEEELKEEIKIVEEPMIRENNEIKNIEEIVEEKVEAKEEQRCIEDEDISLFSDIDTVDSYRSYKVYIVRQGDTLEKIIENYHISQEELAEYNDLTEIKINDKIIIPALVDETA